MARELYARWGLVVIFASGEVMAARQARDVALGYLRKPYEMQALLQSVEALGAMMANTPPKPTPRSFERFAQPETGWAS